MRIYVIIITEKRKGTEYKVFQKVNKNVNSKQSKRNG